MTPLRFRSLHRLIPDGLAALKMLGPELGQLPKVVITAKCVCFVSLLGFFSDARADEPSATSSAPNSDVSKGKVRPSPSTAPRITRHQRSLTSCRSLT